MHRCLAPEIPEPMRRKLGVAHRVLDVFMTEIGLQRASVVAGIGQGIACRVPQHVRVNRERHSRALADAMHRGVEALGRHRTTALGREHMRSKIQAYSIRSFAIVSTLRKVPQFGT